VADLAGTARPGSTSPTDPTREWVPARVLATRRETARATTFRLDLGRPSGHRAGQHVKVRVTPPGGSPTSRSYSIASAPDGGSVIELTVERLDGGVVSGHLHDRVHPGATVSVRGPKGTFTWGGTTPALLVGGGSGLVPLMAMLRLARRTGQSGLVRLVASARAPGDLFYRDELVGPEVSVIHTRAAGSLVRQAGRLTVDDLAPLFLPGATAFVCGSKGFAGAARDLLLGLGVPAERIRVEAFGPTATAEVAPAPGTPATVLG